MAHGIQFKSAQSQDGKVGQIEGEQLAKLNSYVFLRLALVILSYSCNEFQSLGHTSRSNPKSLCMPVNKHNADQLALYKIRAYAVMRLILPNKQILKHTAIKILIFTIINRSTKIVIKYLTSLKFVDLVLLPCLYLILPLIYKHSKHPHFRVAINQ